MRGLFKATLLLAPALALASTEVAPAEGALPTSTNLDELVLGNNTPTCLGMHN